MRQRNLALFLAFCMLLAAFVCTQVFSIADNEYRVLCIGESLTCGSGANEAGTITEQKKDGSGNPVFDSDGNPVMQNSKINPILTYPGRLDIRLGYGYQVLNYGISGVAVLPEYKWSWASGGYLAAAKNNPSNPFAASVSDVDYIVIMLGTNDAKDRIWKTDKGTGGAENFYNYYLEMVRELQKIPSEPDIICVIPPPVVNDGVLNDYEIVEKTLRDEISPIIRRVARENHCMLLDLREVFPNPETEREELLSYYAVDDAVHPNKSGYDLIAQSLVPYIKRVKGDVNGSGVTSIDDLSVLAQYLAKWHDVEIDDLRADVNLDGVVNLHDLALIAQYQAKWDVKLY